MRVISVRSQVSFLRSFASILWYGPFELSFFCFSNLFILIHSILLNTCSFMYIHISNFVLIMCLVVLWLLPYVIDQFRLFHLSFSNLFILIHSSLDPCSFMHIHISNFVLIMWLLSCPMTSSLSHSSISGILHIYNQD